MRRRLLLLLADLILVALATLAAFALRDNLELSTARLADALPYLGMTLAAAAPLLMALGLDRTLWRFSAAGDYLRIAMAAAMIALAAIVLGFAVNRLDGVARALPVLQALLIAVFLTGGRAFVRLRGEARRPARPPGSETVPEPPAYETVLVIGINRITELYLEAVAEFAAGRVRIVGLLGHRERHKGRLVRQYRVLGTPEALPQILRDLEIHGVSVDRIVVTCPFEKLSAGGRDAILALEKTSAIRADFFAGHVGLHEECSAPSSGGRTYCAPLRTPPSSAPESGTSAFAAAAVEAALRPPYQRAKRAADIAGALCLIPLAAPVMLIVAALVLIALGPPLTFWQQRPGRGGVPFRLYKFRTMTAAHDSNGRLIPDGQRSPPIGRLLRRFRLDELPQIFNILAGDMSFVGPRPLLPRDQPDGGSVRLLVRPGLTGWAQVNGGRGIPAEDKNALDLWYLKNASLRLDLQILWRTAVVLVRGERRNGHAIRVARREAGFIHVAPATATGSGMRFADRPVRAPLAPAALQEAA